MLYSYKNNNSITFNTHTTSLNSPIMKKFLSLLLIAIPLSFAVTSCNDDNDLPNVDMSIAISGGQRVDNVIYVVQGDTLQIDSIGVTNNEPGKAAAITAATYYWDYQRLGTSLLPPYGFAVVTTAPTANTPGTPLGKHLLEITCPLLAVDKEVATCVLAYTVQVVASPDDIPDGTVQNSFPGTPSIRSN